MKYKNLSLRTQRVLAFFVSVLMSGFLGGLVGYSYATGGEMPFQPTQVIALPTQSENYTSEDVEVFMEADNTELNKYDTGFNCVEYALLLARNAHWQGLPAQVISLTYKEGVGHMILAFATEDKGWLFIEPGTGKKIYPKIGQIYGSRRITEMMILQTRWIPFEEACEGEGK